MSFAELSDSLLEGLKMPLGYLIDPEKRLNVVYLLSALALAYFVYWRMSLKGGFLAYIFQREIWLSRSAFVDYGLIFFNAFFKVFLIGPYLVFGFYLSFQIEEWLPILFGYPSASLSATATIVWYTITLTVFNDLGTFLIHYLMHHIPQLWEFHKVHHSATVLNPVTQYRIHPVELILNNVVATFVLGSVTGLFRYLSAHPISELTFIGVNVFSFAFLFFGANLRHSHVPMRYFNWLEYIVISPFQHQIHHSNRKEHFDRNLGSKFALWDWMFGSLVRSEDVDSVEFGIGNDEDKDFDSLWKSLSNPFVKLWRHFF